ncbi:hypothetical protein OB955_14350 [Halobacteria archaeon AArc-m2/3/4]|uniref:ArsR family transcriptional regulator n=1 Tax=Natronoglomus mannanivorans TaxID=2979990 RepID=A0ABT2QG62_9EURY|nr:hypothetical protein [Halobacteria archaeon AArc-m2/3/4]
MNDRRQDTERNDENRIRPEEIVDSIRTAPKPVVNTRYLADRFGVSLEEMFRELDSLAADGVVEKLEVSGYLHLWELSRETDLGDDSESA